MRGIVTNVFADRGFCFVATEGGETYFCHASRAAIMLQDLQRGQVVEFGPAVDGQGRNTGSIIRIVVGDEPAEAEPEAVDDGSTLSFLTRASR